MESLLERLNNMRRVIWPIEIQEIKKFLPMAAMMFFILFNYSTLRSMKDGFVVTGIGPEAISFLKLYCVLPSAIIIMLIYSKLCNVMSQQKVFYTIGSFFTVYLAVFTFILFPHPEVFHMSSEHMEDLIAEYPNLQWFIRIIANWSYATFYIIAELWGSMMLSLLFWQFANQITKTEEAKRFYSMFGLLGNFALPLTALVLSFFLNEHIAWIEDLGGSRFTPILCITIIASIAVMVIYGWMNAYVLTDKRFYDPSAVKAKKSKAKLSLKDSFKMIFTSKYLAMIAILVISYGISINLVEGVWKAKIRQLYPSKEDYTNYMATFQAYQGVAAILFMIIGSNILRSVSWFQAAIITPAMILVTGAAFFVFVVFDNEIAMHMTGILASTPLAMAVMMGMVQNVLSKATKYSLFDSTKEMSYIPLDDEEKTKGKAAVDVVGARLGKSGGAMIQSTVFLITGCTFAEATPFFAGVFVVITILWLYAVKVLSKEYQARLAKSNK